MSKSVRCIFSNNESRYVAGHTYNMDDHLFVGTSDGYCYGGTWLNTIQVLCVEVNDEVMLFVPSTDTDKYVVKEVGCIWCWDDIYGIEVCRDYLVVETKNSVTLIQELNDWSIQRVPGTDTFTLDLEPELWEDREDHLIPVNELTGTKPTPVVAIFKEEV